LQTTLYYMVVQYNLNVDLCYMSRSVTGIAQLPSTTTSLTTSKDILEAVAVGAGPKKLIFSLGYAGWTPNQLEQEIVQNSWLSVQAKDIETLNKILFDTPHEEQLNAAISLLGFDPAMLSDVAGHA